MAEPIDGPEFKSQPDGADDELVNEHGTASDPRTGVASTSGGTLPGSPDAGAPEFSFNLGEALARLTSDSDDDPRAVLASLAEVDWSEPAPAAAEPASADPSPVAVPEIQEATPVPGAVPGLDPVAPAAPPASAATAAPTLGATPTLAASAPSVPPTAPPPTLQPTTLQPAAGAVALADVPVLGAAPAAPAPPMAAPPTAAPTTPLPTRPLSPQVRKAQRKSRFAPRLFLALLIVGGLVAGALVFGREYLFPNEWERELVPTVEQLQATTGLEFEDPVVIRPLPAADHAASVVTTAFGDDWLTKVPRWRALGLAQGEVTAETVLATTGEWWPVHYDAATGDGTRLDSLTGATLEDRTAEALAIALFDQTYGPRAAATAATTPGSVAAEAAVESWESVAARAVIDHQAELTADVEPTSSGRARVGRLPAPMGYELLAIEELGRPLLTALGVQPTAAAPQRSMRVLDSATELLSPEPRAAGSPELVEGDLVDGSAEAMGRDQWFLVFASYLPPDVAGAASDAIAADLVTPVVRGERECVYGTLTASAPETAGVLQLTLQAWVAAAPPEAGATTTVLADGTLQLSACDPGPSTQVTPRAGVAAELVERQIARLGG